MKGASPLRIVLDVNIFVSDIIGRSLGRRGTTSQKLVDAMLAGKIGDRPAQLVISLAMLESFRGALLRLRAPTASIESATEALLDLTRNGPDRLDPYLLLDTGHAAFSMQDREDAGVLAIAFAANADLLVTDNLADFATKDCVSIETSQARHADGSERQLSCQFHRSPTGRELVVAHPLDVAARMAKGQAVTFDDLTEAAESIFARRDSGIPKN
ncbi:PIN domain-containing protein [Methylosinus sp. KRF6]|uniref:PIN domain-containing protein n=1 Tax=Methylosinus sp. KRF6 TaxID=2846853 RepID=UPI001C0DC3F8|nr:PIN domain-containing protein [Methylosinus sp. KRF6]MBU3887907.1 PIN domain-containing protein [Methylosinus sp. KRF6]